MSASAAVGSPPAPLFQQHASSSHPIEINPTNHSSPTESSSEASSPSMADDGDPMDLYMSSILPPQSQNHDTQPGQGSMPQTSAADQPGPGDAMDTTADESAAPEPSIPPSPRSPPDPNSSLLAPSPSHQIALDQQTNLFNENVNVPSTDPGSEEDSDQEGYEEPEEFDDDEYVTISEDDSFPTEEELKKITSHDEQNASDDTFWEQLLRKDFPIDPEYSLGESGIINWSINGYNGTKDNPNRHLIMRSHFLQLGNFTFRVIFYPKGNRTDYLSIYVECMEMSTIKQKLHGPAGRQPHQSSRKSPSPSSPTSKNPNVTDTAPAFHIRDETLYTPIPLLDNTPIKRRPSVAARLVVLLYNPAEPRVVVHHTANHRFCPNHPDWGWDRFHGPIIDLGKRRPTWRAPLLKHDKLAIKAYIQLVNDETGCLYERVDSKNVWDPFAMTGLRPFRTDAKAPHAVIAAVSTWLLFRPFRDLLYQTQVPHIDYEHHVRPKPMITAFQIMLCSMRAIRTETRIYQDHKFVDIEPLKRALEWYGLLNIAMDSDVIELWEILRSTILDELIEIKQKLAFFDVFGPKKDRTDPKPRHRVSVKGLESIQQAVDQNSDLIDANLDPPQLLHIELDRQCFDEKSRTWTKVLDSIIINDKILIRTPTPNASNGNAYRLYGIVTHDRDIKSHAYKSILRPDGPNTAWLEFNDFRSGYNALDARAIQRLTQQKAIAQHQGGKKIGEIEPCVAYIALYVRDNISQNVFEPRPEPWNPSWLAKSTNKDHDHFTPGHRCSSKSSKFKGTWEVKAIRSTQCLGHQGPGVIELFRRTGEVTVQPLTFQLPGNSKAKDVQKAIAEKLNLSISYKAVKLWALNPHDTHGHYYSPVFARHDTSDDRPFGKPSKSEEPRDSAERWIYFHIMDEKYMDFVRAETKRLIQVSQLLNEASTATQSSSSSSAPPPPPSLATAAQRQSEDTVMSDGDEYFDPMARSGLVGDLQQLLDNPRSIPPPPPSTNNTRLIMATRAAMMNVSGHIPEYLQDMKPWQRYMQLNPTNPEILFFVKVWHPKSQTLMLAGAFLAKHHDKIDAKVYKALNIEQKPDSPPSPIWREVRCCDVELIKRRKSFADIKAVPGVIFICQPEPFLDEAADSLNCLEHGNFADVKSYLTSWNKNIAFPDRLQDATYTLNYFGQEYYHGLLHGHEPQGPNATKIYFSGNTYTGDFMLGYRHGTGTMTYANGDAYTGGWKRDEHDGLGKYTEASSGNVYEGGWSEGRRYGQGITRWQRAEDGENLCRVCYEGPRDAALNDCGHVIACISCARQLQHCPTCRRRVLNAIKLFYA